MRPKTLPCTEEEEEEEENMSCARKSQSLKSEVVLLQTTHSWANAGVLLGAGMHLERGSFRNIWYEANRLGNSCVHTLGDNSAIVNPAGQLLLTRRGKTRMDGVSIVFEFYTGPL